MRIRPFRKVQHEKLKETTAVNEGQLMEPTKAITDKEFAEWMNALGISPADGPFVVGVSGGADSMALAFLMSRFGETKCLTFDHGLRPQSSQEALQVARWMSDWGLEHQTLKWGGDKPSSDIQDKARMARYKAMQKWCFDRQIQYLLVAHHQGDQAETFMMRLMRGSGVDGLAAMAPVSEALYTTDGPKIVRPLLNVSKARLLETLKARGQKWIEDPSNTDDRYLRVKVRELIRDNDDIGLSERRLADTAKRMARTKNLLDKLTEDLAVRSVNHNPLGYCTLDTDVLLQADEELTCRLLSKILKHYGGGFYPANLEAVERLNGQIASPEFVGCTLSGCRIARDRKKGQGRFIRVYREEHKIASAKVELICGKPLMWDGRFRVQLLKDLDDCNVQKMDRGIWRTIEKAAPKIKELAIPAAVQNSLPCVMRKEEVLAVPSLFYSRAMKRYFDIGFKPFQL